MISVIDKPHKFLASATFIGSALYGKNEDGGTVKTSRILHRWSETHFETENTHYTVNFIDGAECTIPKCWENWPAHRLDD